MREQTLSHTHSCRETEKLTALSKCHTSTASCEIASIVNSYHKTATSQHIHVEKERWRKRNTKTHTHTHQCHQVSPTSHQERNNCDRKTRGSNTRLVPGNPPANTNFQAHNRKCDWWADVRRTVVCECPGRVSRTATSSWSRDVADKQKTDVRFLQPNILSSHRLWKHCVLLENRVQ